MGTSVKQLLAIGWAINTLNSKMEKYNIKRLKGDLFILSKMT